MIFESYFRKILLWKLWKSNITDIFNSETPKCAEKVPK